MRVRIVGRASAYALATCLAAGGCAIGGGSTPPGGPGGEPGGPRGEPTPPEMAPLSSCTVTGRAALAGPAPSPAIAFGGGRFGVVWSGGGAGGGNIMLPIPDGDGRGVHEGRVADGPGTAPAVAALRGGGF